MQRAAIAEMTLEDIYEVRPFFRRFFRHFRTFSHLQNRKAFSMRVFKGSAAELSESMGFVLVSYGVKAVTDDVGYLKALGENRIKRDNSAQHSRENLI